MAIQTIVCPGPKSYQKLVESEMANTFPFHYWNARRALLQESPWAKVFPDEGGAQACAYCGVEWHPDKFHPGSCGECGGPKS